MQGKKAFWHVILHSYLGTLCVSFASKSKAINVFPKHILKSKARDHSIQARKKFFLSRDGKELFVQRFVKIFNQNWKQVEREIKEQATQLTLLYRGRTVRSSQQSCCIRKLFLKILQYPQETSVLESIFKKAANLSTCNFI